MWRVADLSRLVDVLVAFSSLFLYAFERMAYS